MEQIWVGQTTVICMYSIEGAQDKWKYLAIYGFGKGHNNWFHNISHVIYTGH